MMGSNPASYRALLLLPWMLVLLSLASMFTGLGGQGQLSHPSARIRTRYGGHPFRSTPTRSAHDQLPLKTVPSSPSESDVHVLRSARKTLGELSKHRLNSLSMDMGPVPAAIIAAQTVALVGAAFTGYLSKKRRDEIHSLNEQLRTINAELRTRENALIEKEAVISYIDKREGAKADRERSNEEEFSPEERQVYALIEEGKANLDEGESTAGIEKLSMALLNADKLDTKRFSVNSRRALADGYRKLGNYEEALDAYLTAFKLAAGYPEAVHSRVALCGEIADLYTDMGELRKAAEYYDRWIAGM
mmetsp:Transcript_24965/g.60054  ORF Transcript_24965/g.60054 Transcript_24965/m.60054 type:complete len:304 (+) Transcript_24965:191-1102(+)